MGKGGNARSRYRYYVSRDLQHGLRGDKTDGWRIPAQEIESLIAGHLTALLGDPITLVQTLGLPMPAPDAIAGLMTIGKTLSQEPLKALKRVILYADRIEGEASINSIATILGLADPKDTDTYRFTIPVKLARSGMALKLVHSNGTAVVQSSSTQTLVKTIARGHRWWQLIRDGQMTASQLAAQEGVTNSYLNRILRLAFLDPYIIDMIIVGKHSASLDAKKLTLGIELLLKWNDQRAVLGISTSH